MNVSIIVPAYNEEKRMTPFLKSLLEFSQANLKDYEIIIVNDGSTDRSAEIIRELIKNYSNTRLVSYEKNQGKGYAVKTGVFEANGEKIIFIDADGSIQPKSIPAMIEKLDENDVVVGDRRSKDSSIKITMTRIITGKTFNLIARTLYGLSIKDTLCGFKGFKRNAARNLFSNLISNRWIFDVELFYKIKKKGYKMHQLPFEWEHKEGSKITLIDPLKMFFRLIQLRIKLLKQNSIAIMNQEYTLEEIWKLKKSIIAPMLSPSKAANFILVKISEIFKTTKVRGYPYSMLIEPTAFCNLQCPMCLKTQKCLKRKEGNMTLEQFELLMDELGKRMITLRFWNYGEPLMNRELFKMVKIAKKHRIFTVVSTNALLFNEQNIAEMLESGLDYLIISFDGATKESYEKHRKNGNFETLLRNMELLMEKKRGKKLPFISMQFIVMKDNEKEVDSIKDFARKFGVDKISLRRLNLVSEKVKAMLLPENELFRDQPAKNKNKNWCSILWEESIINYNGDVTPCCMDAAMQHVFGNVFNEGNFKKVWNNQKYRAFRKAVMNNIDRIDICGKDCYKRSNKINFIEL